MYLFVNGTNDLMALSLRFVKAQFEFETKDRLLPSIWKDSALHYGTGRQDNEFPPGMELHDFQSRFLSAIALRRDIVKLGGYSDNEKLGYAWLG